MMVEAAGVELTAPTIQQMVGLHGFTPDFSHLLNIYTRSINSKSVVYFNQY
jgi:hypothetical protein